MQQFQFHEVQLKDSEQTDLANDKVGFNSMKYN